MFLVPSVFSCYKKLSIEFLNDEINIRVFAVIVLITNATDIHVLLFFIKFNAKWCCFLIFIETLTFVSGGSLSTSIWLVVTLCTLFFLDGTVNNYQEVVWKLFTSVSLYDMYSGYGSSCFLSFLIRQSFTEKNKNKFNIGIFKRFVSGKGGTGQK